VRRVTYAKAGQRKILCGKSAVRADRVISVEGTIQCCTAERMSVWCGSGVGVERLLSTSKSRYCFSIVHI